MSPIQTYPTSPNDPGANPQPEIHEPHRQPIHEPIPDEPVVNPEPPEPTNDPDGPKIL